MIHEISTPFGKFEHDDIDNTIRIGRKLYDIVLGDTIEVIRRKHQSTIIHTVIDKTAHHLTYLAQYLDDEDFEEDNQDYITAIGTLLLRLENQDLLR